VGGSTCKWGELYTGEQITQERGFIDDSKSEMRENFGKKDVQMTLNRGRSHLKSKKSERAGPSGFVIQGGKRKGRRKEDGRVRYVSTRRKRKGLA